MADHRLIDVGGVRLAYQVSGPPEAPPLLLLHALGENSTDWEPLVPAFAQHWHVHVPDLRGHGRSEWPGKYSLELMRDDVLGFMDALGLDRVDVIGHSMGGVAAYLLAEDHAQRVRRLVLEDVPAPLPRQVTSPIRPDGQLTFDWEAVPALRRQIDTPDPRWLERLSGITAETLVVAGGPSSHVDQEGVAELARRIPRGRLVTIPAGHMVHAVEPVRFTRAALSFLRQEDEGSS
ncbi:alpha/beta hydrolase [Streptomyces sp. SID4982]|uniref:alpha/beta fold hydrolase n=1 Tax=Streptomyces sp. SID4982 TaxID=2690291 RepID=UPI001369EE01|nr:alpha/beta hydrolase [Streptomyces sp. SID4982]MYS14913.1 alpha/beta fold hydrolase [Streptomyces sp. SID4982]